MNSRSANANCQEALRHLEGTHDALDEGTNNKLLKCAATESKIATLNRNAPQSCRRYPKIRDASVTVHTASALRSVSQTG